LHAAPKARKFGKILHAAPKARKFGKILHAAPKARNIKARGKSRLCRDVAPGNEIKRCDAALKGRNNYFGLSVLDASFYEFNQGRRAPLRFALAPGYYIPRRWRCFITI
jgi:hypothetical protein